MMNRFKTWCWVMAMVLGFTAQTIAASPQHTSVSLLKDLDAVRPGQTLWVDFHFRLEDGWHTYWKTPGDSGVPLRLSWTLPEGVEVGEIHYLPPSRFEAEGLISFGYHHATDFLVPITIPENAALGTYTLSVKADWLVCEDICIPESETLTLPIQVSEIEKPSADYQKITGVKGDFPTPFPNQGTYQIEDDGITLYLLIPDGVAIDGVDFFPNPNVLVGFASPKWTLQNNQLQIQVEKGYEDPQGDLSGVLMTRFQNQTEFWEVTFSQGSVSHGAKIPFWSALLLAVLGGLILNLMPCVFPILSLKALQLAGHAHDAARFRRESVAYTVGVCVSFLVLGGLLIGFQHFGVALGWGFHLQSPFFVAVLVNVMVMVGWYLSGFYELPISILSGTSRLQSTVGGRFRNSSFWVGVLAVVVATPCTAPFMAPAIGAALTLPAGLALGIFLGLGLGMALPFLLLSFFPATLQWLPKPGQWMVTFKELMAFPMYAAAVWLMWVLSQQVASSALIDVFVSILALAFGVWVSGKIGSSWKKGLIWVVIVGGIVWGYRQFQPIGVNLPIENTFSESALDAYIQSGTPVLVDVTAAWCITCKVNESTVLHTPETQALFEENGIKTLVADWTRQDPDITRYLQSFDRQGVPLYVLYWPGKSPKVLPQLLSLPILENVMNELKGESL